MDSQELLRAAISEAVEETLDDERINPEEEVERLKSNIESMFWNAYNYRKLERQDSGAYEDEEDE